MKKQNLPEQMLIAAEILGDNKAEDILVLDLHDIHSYLGYFLIVTSLSQVHLKKLSDEIMYAFKSDHSLAQPPSRQDVESGWVILDYHDFLIHLFTKEKRIFYDIESLWSEAKRIDL